jgi:hypothetical protein
MRIRSVVELFAWLVSVMTGAGALADSSGRELASYYERHMALVDGVAHGWIGAGEPRRMRAGVVQVGVSKDAYFALLDDGSLITWTDSPRAADNPTTLMRGVASFAAGHSGWFVIDRSAVLWHGTDSAGATPPRRIAQDAWAACIGDSADYFISTDGTLHVRGLAHRGQYGDGRLAASPSFVATARDAVAVKAHTGHAIHLRRDGVVMGTGGNRFGPLSSHGLGDKADRWGQIFDAARAIATGSRHSVAIRHDASLWAWGEGFAIEPRKLLDGVAAVAAGDTATIALTLSGDLWQWERGGAPRRLVLR